MRLKTFRAQTMADALAAVKKDLGRDAVILHTRTAKVGGWPGLLGAWLGLGVKSVVEIVASSDVNVAGPRVKGAAQARAADVADRVELSAPAAACAVAERTRPSSTSPVSLAAAPFAGAVEAPPPNPGAAAPVVLPVRKRGGRTEAAGEPGPQRSAVAATFAPADGAARESLESELACIKRMVGQVLQASTPAAAAPLMPEALFKHYLRLLEGQVARDVADRLVGQVRDELTPSELLDESIVRTTLLRHLAAMIPVAAGTAVAAPTRATDGRPMTIALIGPTGVGKTTTVAKLAATYKLRYGRKVGLITCDTYRIAAVDQLRTYATIIAVPLRVVLTPDEMRSACDAMADCDVILIDTAGRSQHDAARLDELAGFLAAARPHQTHLVLSSAASEPVLRKTAERFAVARPDHLILTKLDEAVNFGVLVNVAQLSQASLSFVTTGQEVPDHIEPGQADRLARLVLDGELAR